MNSVKYHCQNHHQKPLQSLLLGESLDPSASLMKMSGKHESYQLPAPGTIESLNPRTSPAWCSRFSLSTSEKKLSWWTWLLLRKLFKTVQWENTCPTHCSMRAAVLQPLRLCEASISHSWLNSLFLHPFRQDLCCYYYGKLGKKNKTKTKQQNTKKKHVLFGELRVAMFVATPAFRNKGVIYWNGEISDFPNTSCGGTGPLLPPYNVPHHFWSSRSCTNATTSGSAHYATNNPHKPLNIYILFKCRISWWSG